MQRGKTHGKSNPRFENTLKKNGQRDKPSRSRNNRLQNKIIHTPKIVKQRQHEKMIQSQGIEFILSILKVLIESSEAKEREHFNKLSSLFEKEQSMRKIIRSKKQNVPQDMEQLASMVQFIKKEQRETLNYLKIFLGQQKLQKLDEQDTREDLLRVYSLVTSETLKQAESKKSRGCDLVYEISTKFDEQRRAIRLMSKGIEKIYSQVNLKEEITDSPASSGTNKSQYSSVLSERSIGSMLMKISEKLNEKKDDTYTFDREKQKRNLTGSGKLQIIQVNEIPLLRNTKLSSETPSQNTPTGQLLQKILSLEKENLHLFKSMKQLQEDFECIVHQKFILEEKLKGNVKNSTATSHDNDTLIQDENLQTSQINLQMISSIINFSINPQQIKSSRAKRDAVRSLKSKTKKLKKQIFAMRNLIIKEMILTKNQFIRISEDAERNLKNSSEYEEIIFKLESEREIEINKYLKIISNHLEEKKKLQVLIVEKSQLICSLTEKIDELQERTVMRRSQTIERECQTEEMYGYLLIEKEKLERQIVQKEQKMVQFVKKYEQIEKQLMKLQQKSEEKGQMINNLEEQILNKNKLIQSSSKNVDNLQKEKQELKERVTYLSLLSQQSLKEKEEIWMKREKQLIMQKNETIEECGMFLEQKTEEIKKVWQKVQRISMSAQDLSASYQRLAEKNKQKQIQKEKQKYYQNTKFFEQLQNLLKMVKTISSDLQQIRNLEKLNAQISRNFQAFSIEIMQKISKQTANNNNNKKNNLSIDHNNNLNIEIKKEKNEIYEIVQSYNIQIMSKKQQLQQNEENKSSMIFDERKEENKEQQPSSGNNQSDKNSSIENYIMKTSRNGESANKKHEEKEKEKEQEEQKEEQKEDQNSQIIMEEVSEDISFEEKYQGLPLSSFSLTNLLNQSSIMDEISTLKLQLEESLRLNRILQEQLKMHKQKEMDKIFDF